MKHKIIAIIPARSDSSRLPAKHLRIVNGRPMLYYLVDRLQNMSMINNVIVATTDRAIDKKLCQIADELGCDIYRGSLSDVIGRFTATIDKYKATVAIKANGDNPLQAPEVIETGLKQLLSSTLDLVTGKNAYTGLPVGLGAEIITSKAAKWLNEHTPPDMREDVTRYAFDCNTPVNWEAIEIPAHWAFPTGAITVDTQKDFNYFEQVVSHLPEVKPHQWTIDMILEAMEDIK